MSSTQAPSPGEPRPLRQGTSPSPDPQHKPKTKPETSPATRQSNFEQGVGFSLHLWPALALAVQNSWGGPDSSDKRDWFAGAVVELFPDLVDLAKPPRPNHKPAPRQEPELEDVETTLLQVMLDEFDVNVDDDSGFEVAQQIVRLRTQCAKGQFDEVDGLRRRWQGSKGQKVAIKEAVEADQDTDWESADEEDGDDDDEDDDDYSHNHSQGRDVDTDEAPPLAQIPRDKPSLEVDEDGFTKVTRKKR